MPGAGGEDVIDLNCAAHSAPPGLVEAYQRATEELPAYLSGPGYFPLGVPALQARIAAAYEARGLPTVPEQIMVTAGALAAASVVAQAFTAPGERVVVESPTYPNATQAVRARRRPPRRRRPSTPTAGTSTRWPRPCARRRRGSPT